MRIVYSGKNSKLKTATKRANEVLRDEGFYAEIKNRTYTHTVAKPKSIALSIKNYNFAVTVKTYWNPVGFALAKFKHNDPDSIYINTGKLKRTTNSVVNTLIHEYVHAVDHFDKLLEYGHGGNSNIGKEFSAPYQIGSIAEMMAEEKYPTRYVRRTFWGKVKSVFRRIF